MCGICGIWRLDGGPIDPQLLVRMRERLAHRGPDAATGALFNTRDAGFVLFEGQAPNSIAGESGASFDVGLGHRRLSIIDLATGDQPMTNESRSVWVVYNGEIYNYGELRHDLLKRGHMFRTASDTEVIVHAYEQYGLDCPSHFNGIFAFAIWDAPQRRLFLARDRFGVKPLYYATHGGVFRFASELKAILADPSVPRDLDVDALNLCLSFRHTPSPWTLFKEIRKLPPASYAVVDSNGLALGRYSEQVAGAAVAVPEAELVPALRERLEQAVRRQMVSDVPISLSLSSGVDSSTLLAIMSRSSAGRVRSFTVGFADQVDNCEVSPASEAARMFGADFHSQVISSDDYDRLLERYIWHLEEPIGNESAPAYYFVARMAQMQGIKVMLNGQGPDEVFAGYTRHLAAAYGTVLGYVPTRFARSVLVPIADRLPVPEVHRRLAYSMAGTSEVDQLLAVYTFVSPAIRANLLNPGVQAVLNPDLARDYVAGQLDRAPAGTRLERMLYVDTRTSLPDNLLLCEDKMAMAASVEARVPFLDTEFMALAERVPGRLKVRHGRGKHIHRRVCAAFVPAEITRRPKIGFDNAVAVWLRARLGHKLRRAVDAPDSLTRTWLNPHTVHAMIHEHSCGHRDHQRILFLLLSIEAWHRTFIVNGSAN